MVVTRALKRPCVLASLDWWATTTLQNQTFGSPARPPAWRSASHPTTRRTAIVWHAALPTIVDTVWRRRQTKCANKCRANTAKTRGGHWKHVREQVLYQCNCLEQKFVQIRVVWGNNGFFFKKNQIKSAMFFYLWSFKHNLLVIVEE